MRRLAVRMTAALALLALLSSPSSARAQSSPAAPPAAQPAQPTPDVQELEATHRESIAARRALSKAVLVTGLVSVAGGGALIIPDADDQAFRFAGYNTALFGAVNTLVALIALHGIAKEEDAWESPEGAAARRSPDGARRARAHAAIDEQRESTSHAINLGLGAAYLGVAGTAILASRLGVDHPKRWLGSGVAIGVQAVFLVGIDYIGLRRSSHYHRLFVEGLVPDLSVVPTDSGTQTNVSIHGTF